MDDYNDMVDNPSDKPWFCSVCSEPSSGDSNLSILISHRKLKILPAYVWMLGVFAQMPVQWCAP